MAQRLLNPALLSLIAKNVIFQTVFMVLAKKEDYIIKGEGAIPIEQVFQA